MTIISAPATREGNLPHFPREKDSGRFAFPMALARNPWGETAAGSRFFGKLQPRADKE
jgi:hypothetical protein